MAKKPTKAETNTPFNKEFPEVRIAMDKAHNMLSKAFLGEVSLKEARVSVRDLFYTIYIMLMLSLLTLDHGNRHPRFAVV